MKDSPQPAKRRRYYATGTCQAMRSRPAVRGLQHKAHKRALHPLIAKQPS